MWGRGFAANAAHGTISNHLGELKGDLGFVPHKIAHFVAGMVRGGIISKGDVQTMLTGGGAAAFAETVADLMLPNPASLPEQIRQQSVESGQPLSGQALNDAVNAKIQQVADISRLITTSAAILLGRDPDAVSVIKNGERENICFFFSEGKPFHGK